MSNKKSKLNLGKDKTSDKPVVKQEVEESVTETTVSNDNFAKERKELLDKIELYRSQIEKTQNTSVDIKEYVPKEKLQNETLVERINWWYKDLGTTKNKVVANIVGIVMILATSVGVYFGVVSIETVTEIGDKLGGIFATIATIVTTVLGIITQLTALKTPKK